MTPHTLFAPATSPAPFWCGPLETEHTVAATNVDELPLEDLLGRLAEATAAADACRREGTAAEGGFPAPFVADAFRVRPLRPVPAESPLQIRARVIGVAEGLTVVAGTVLAGGMPVAEATVVARRQNSPSAGAALRHLVQPPAQTPGCWPPEGATPPPLRRIA